MYIFLWHLTPSCGRFSITYSRLRFLFLLGGQMSVLNWQTMTHFSDPAKIYNRWSLLSHEYNSRHKKRAPERHVHFYYSNPLLRDRKARIPKRIRFFSLCQWLVAINQWHDYLVEVRSSWRLYLCSGRFWFLSMWQHNNDIDREFFTEMASRKSRIRRCMWLWWWFLWTCDRH